MLQSLALCQVHLVLSGPLASSFSPFPPLTSPQVASMSFLVLLNTKLAASVSGAS